MNRFSRHELFGSQSPDPPSLVPETPVRSDFAREPNYARRRIITVAVLVVVLGGGSYALWGGSTAPTDPTDIPTIKAEGEYKQKPTDPGGIDIPHQDVRVYDQLEGKNASAPAVEHLLPLPETPKEAPPPAVPPPVAAAPVAAASTPPKTDILQTPPAKLVDTTVQKVQTPPASVEKVQPAAISAATTAPVAITPAAPTETPKAEVAVAPVPKVATPVKTPAAPKAEALSMDQVIEKLNAKMPASEALPTNTSGGAQPKTSGAVVVQLASSSNESQAQSLMKQLQQKYATQLGGTQLHLTRADLGSKGIFYRIQSESLAKDEASRLCASLKKLNAGCILVGK